MMIYSWVNWTEVNVHVIFLEDIWRVLSHCFLPETWRWEWELVAQTGTWWKRCIPCCYAVVQKPLQARSGLQAGVCLSFPAERTAALLPGRTQVLLHQSNSSGWQRKVFPHLHVHLHGERLHISPCAEGFGAVCSVFLFSSSPTRAQTYCSPWRPGTGTSPESWPTITKETSCKTFWCNKPVLPDIFLLFVSNVRMFPRYFLSTEDDPKRRHLYRWAFSRSYEY